MVYVTPVLLVGRGNTLRLQWALLISEV